MSETIRKRDLTFKVFRFNSDTDYLPYYKEYTLEVTHEDVVLDILNKIKWEHSGSLSYRRSCRHGICGSCSVKVNNKAVLACKQNMFELADIWEGENTLIIDPLDKKRAVKDLIIDKKNFWDNYNAVNPYLMGEIDEDPKSEHLITPDSADQIDEADYCIQCRSCFYSCPVMEVNDEFFGPAAFVKAYRYTVDERDKGVNDRLEIVNQAGSGIWDCVKCFECAEACPKEINPIEKITRLHNQVFDAGIAKSNVATRHAVGFKHSIKKHGLLDEGQLVVYSEGLAVVKHIPEAFEMWKNGKIVMPWNMPKSDNLDEIKTLVKNSSRTKW